MICEFDCWRPGQGQTPPTVLRLTGDTHEELAWSLLEQHRAWAAQRHEREGEGDLGPATGHVLETERFGEAWWRRQERLLAQGWSNGYLAKMAIGDFRQRFPVETLFAIHAFQLIGRFYATHHGDYEGTLTPKGLLAYFERARCLRWIAR